MNNCDFRDWKELLFYTVNQYSETEFRLDDYPTIFNISLKGIRLFVTLSWESDNISVAVGSEECAHCGMDEFADQLDFTEQNAFILDRDLEELFCNGWKEKHYFLFGDTPWKRATWFRNEKSTTYYEGCLSFLFDFLSLGLLGLISRKRTVRVKPSV